MTRWKNSQFSSTWMAFAFISVLYLRCAVSETTYSEKETTIEETDDFSIECRISDEGDPKWTRNGELILPDNKKGYELSQTMTRDRHLIMRLHVHSAELDHEGEYRCNGLSRNFHYVNVLPLNGNADEDEPYDQTSKSDVILKVDGEINLFCSAAKDDYVEVSWYKDGQRIDDYLYPHVTISGRYLTLTKTQVVDAGEYVCTIDNPFEARPMDFGRVFQVQTAAEVLDFPERVSVMRGRNLTLQCKIHGHPSPLVHWFIGNERVENLKKNDKRIWLFSDERGRKNTILSVENIKYEDRDLYTCVAENFLGFDESSVMVFIRDNMIETNEPEPGKGIILKPGHQLVLQCNTSECPLCKIGWFKDGNTLNMTDTRIHVLAENNSLVIDKATEDDTGNYVCAVIRDDLDLNINATIPVLTEVTVDPFHKSHKSMNLVQGDELILNCNANGRPKPVIKWFKGSNPLNTNESRIKLTSGSSGIENSILTIGDLDFGDRDYYTCEADNGISTANTTILVRVKDKLAALWPFLGICAEVAILCSIIFIYEKKRGKPDFDESDTDHNQENKNVPDQKGKSHDVRQRK